MQSITLKSHIGSDGLLKVHLPDMRDRDIEVVIVYQTTLPKAFGLSRSDGDNASL